MARTADSGEYYDYEGTRSQRRKDRVAEALLMEGSNYAPVQHWMQGVARALQGTYGGYLASQNDKREAADEQALRDSLLGLPGLGGAGGPQRGSTAPAIQPAPIPAPRTIPPPGPNSGSGNSVPQSGVAAALAGGPQSSNVIDRTGGQDWPAFPASVRAPMAPPSPSARPQPTFPPGRSGMTPRQPPMLPGPPDQLPPQAAQPPAPPMPPPQEAGPPMPGVERFANEGFLPSAVHDFSNQPGRQGHQFAGGAPEGIVLHDVSGNPANRRLPAGGNIPNYHVTFDDTPGGVYQERDLGTTAPHAAALNSRYAGVARRAFEGDPITPQGVINGANAVKLVSQKYNIPIERLLTHPEAGPTATRRGGKDPREGEWKGAILAYLKDGTLPAEGGVSHETQVASGPTPMGQRSMTAAAGLGGGDLPGMMKLGGPAPEGGGNDQMAEYIRGLLANPKTRAMGLQLYQQHMAPRTEEQQLDAEGKRLSNQKLRSELEMKNRTASKDPAKMIAGGLNQLASIPGQFTDDTFAHATGTYQGDPNSWIGDLARIRGSVGNMFGEKSTSEVRSRINADSDALAATIKPLIRGPGEGAWSDADQAMLTRIVGNLAQSNSKAEYMRNLEGVRERVMANFGIDLPPIGNQGSPGGQTGKFKYIGPAP